MIMPGVSGGVIAVVLNVYDKILVSLKDIKSNKLFLVKILIGIVLGIILGANIILDLYNKYYVVSSYIFIGLILGTIPFLINEYKSKTNEKLDIINLFISIIIMLLLSINTSNISSDITIFKLILSGIMYSFGKIIPGISSTALLSSINMYSYYLNIFKNPYNFILNNYMELIYIIIGFILGLVIFYKLINYLLDKHYSITYTYIIGFSISSVVMLYPKEFNLLCIIYILIGFIISYKLSNKK